METISWQDRDGARWIELSGELDQNAYLELNEPFDAAVHESRSDVIVVLSGATFLCSMVIGLFVKAHSALQERGHALRVRGLRPLHQSVFKTMNLYDMLVDEE